LGFVKPENKYQKRKEQTIFDFLFFQKKINNKKKLNEFEQTDIEKYIETKDWKEGTKKERRAILQAFYRRNSLE